MADPVIFFAPNQMDNLLKSGLDSAIRSGVSPVLAARLLGSGKGNEAYLLVVRADPGLVEIHEHWDDVVIIRSGRGILKTGYEVTGEKKEEKGHSGNWTGGNIEGGKDRNLSPGDFIVIPALLAHQYIPNSGDTLTYWTIKVRASKANE